MNQSMLFGPLKKSNETIYYTRIRKVLLSTKTPFQKVEIFDTPLYGKALYLDNEIQSTEADEYIYHESVVHPALFSHPSPHFVLVLGTGEGSTLREVLKHKSVKELTSVEIDPIIISIAKKYLKEWHQGVFADPRCTIQIADAQQYVSKTKKKFDVIISDLPFSVKYRTAPEPLYTHSFFLNIKHCLRPGGIFVMHAGSMIFPKRLSSFKEAYSYAKKAFQWVVPYIVYLDSFHAWVGMLICSETPLPPYTTLIKNYKDRELKLHFYDEETHQHLFSLPRYVRDALKFKENSGE